MFTCFSDEDFAAYAPKKWKSNAFTLERLRVRQKLEALGHALAPSLRSADGSPLAVETSVEHPALWNHHQVDCQFLFFSRNHEAREKLDALINRKRSITSLMEDPSPLSNHIALTVRIDQNTIDIALRLPSDAVIDRDNVKRKLEQSETRETLLQLITSLPSSFEIGIEGAPCISANDCTEATLQTALSLETPNRWFIVRRRFPRTGETIKTEAFLDEIRANLVALLPLYHFMAWSPANDALKLSFRQDPKPSTAVPEKSPATSPKSITPPKSTTPAEKPKSSPAPIAKADRIRVTQGIFRGKTGVVQDIGAKGSLKVQLGSVLVNLNSRDVLKIA